jgi:predicted DNA-binding transcriptional regulator AlpA
MVHTATNIVEYDALLTEVEAAQFLALSVRTLQSWRVKGCGPLFVRAGRAVRYRRSAIADWIEAHTVSATRNKLGGAG